LTILEIMEILDAELLCGQEIIDKEILYACGSDLMSDVLAFVKDHTVLLTGLTNPQVVRTAEMMDISAIVFVRGKRPADEVIQMAAERKMAVLLTKYTMFTACGLLYQGGLRGDVI